MAQIIHIPLTKLQIDPESSRVPALVANQETPSLHLPRHEQRQLIELARHIAENGLNPSELPIVVPAEKQGYYIVLDGNRRMMALKALQNPESMSCQIDYDIFSQLLKASKDYLQSPIETLLCACFEDRAKAALWVRLRHSENRGGAEIVQRIAKNFKKYRDSADQTDANISQNTPWTPDQIALVIMTVRRPQNYLHKTMHSLSSADAKLGELEEIGIAVDNTDSSWVPRLNLAKKLTIQPLTEEENSRVEEYVLHRRACHNYYRSLQLTKPQRGLVICEDDVAFRAGWVEKLCQSLNEMQSHGLSNFVLSLYSSYNHETAAFRRGNYYSSYLAHNFYGTQCVFFCASEIHEISDLIWKKGVESYNAPYDMLLKKYCEKKQNLYTTRFSLAQHMGRSSTGLGNGGHRSPTFHMQWPETGDVVESAGVERKKFAAV